MTPPRQDLERLLVFFAFVLGAGVFLWALGVAR